MQRPSKGKVSNSSPYRVKLPVVDARQKPSKNANGGAIPRSDVALPDIYAPAGPSGPLGPVEGPISPERSYGSEEKVIIIIILLPPQIWLQSLMT